MTLCRRDIDNWLTSLDISYIDKRNTVSVFLKCVRPLRLS